MIVMPAEHVTGRHWAAMRRARKTAPDEILDAFGIREPAVPVKQIALHMGVRVIRSDEHGDWSGQLTFDKGGPTIWTRESDHEVRQRFTIAHELGHLLLHPIERHYRDTTFVGNSKESEANAFAADLLIPFWMLTVAVRSVGRDIEQLARMFRVSLRAMEIRLKYA